MFARQPGCVGFKIGFRWISVSGSGWADISVVVQNGIGWDELLIRFCHFRLDLLDLGAARPNPDR